MNTIVRHPRSNVTRRLLAPTMPGVVLFLALGNLLLGQANIPSDPLAGNVGVGSPGNPGRSSSRRSGVPTVRNVGTVTVAGDDILIAKYHIDEIWNRKIIEASATKVIEDGKTLILSGNFFLASAAKHAALSSRIPTEAELAADDTAQGHYKINEGNRMVQEGQRVLQLIVLQEQRISTQLSGPLNQVWQGANGSSAKGAILGVSNNTVKFLTSDGKALSLPLGEFDPTYSAFLRSKLLQSWLNGGPHSSQDAKLLAKIDQTPTISDDEVASTWATVAGLVADYDATPVSIKFGLLRAFDFDPERQFFFYEIDIAGFGQAVLRSKAALPQEKIYTYPLSYVGTAPVITVGGENKLAGVFELEQTSARGSREELVTKMLPILESIIHYMRVNPGKRAELYAGFIGIQQQADNSSLFTFTGSQLWSDARDFFMADVIANNAVNYGLWAKAESQPVKTVDVGALKF